MTSREPVQIIILSIICIIIFYIQACVTAKTGFRGSEYVVSSVVDLNGEKLELPNGGTIRFMREGCLTNGTVVGANTRIIGAKRGIFENIHIEGVWQVPVINSEFFNDINKDDVLKELFALSSSDVHNKILIKSGEYWLTATSEDKLALKIKGNTILCNNGIIRMRGNDLINYAVIATCGNNITIEGGSYYGERNEHQGTKGEWGHGIRITDGSSNVSVKNVRVYDCWGDGIAVDGNAVNSNVLIENFKISNCRRQGISIIYAKNCTIRNGIITNIQGTEPHLGIDIEPNVNGYCENIIVDNVKIDSEKGIGIFTATSNNQTRQVTIKNCRVNTFGYASFYASRCDGLVILSNEFITTAQGKNHVIVINTGVKNCLIEKNIIHHMADDRSHYCIYSSGKDVRIVDNDLKSIAGVAFYTNNAKVIGNSVNVPQLMTEANNAYGNVFLRNTIRGGILCNAPDNQFVENKVFGDVTLNGKRCEYKNNREKK